MTADALVAAVVAAVRDAIPGMPEVDVDTDLLASGLLDSLAIVALIGLLEDRLGFQFPSRLMEPDTFASAATLARGLAPVVDAASASTV